MPMHVVVVADQQDDDPGWVGERLRELGAELVMNYRDTLPIAADGAATDADLVLLLGSAEAVYDERRREVVDAESALVRQAVGAGVPVIGICYGAQLAAHAFGGSVRPDQRGEVGWFEIASNDDALCPAGPWLQFHSDVFALPPGARVLGATSVGPQGFVLDPLDGRGGVLGWQFHPETAPATLARWVHEEAEYVVRHGGDPAALVQETYERADATRAATYRLVDAALDHLLQCRKRG